MNLVQASTQRCHLMVKIEIPNKSRSRDTRVAKYNTKQYHHRVTDFYTLK